MPDPAYVLGHSERELERLRAQARLIEPITRGFFREAGIAPGMRVLDIGSGAGDVAFLAAELVGPSGEVLGIDRAAVAVASASRAARERSLANVSFREGDAADMSFARPFDAIVGRYVLLFQADAAATLRALSRHLKTGGLMVFHEPDWVAARSSPAAPTYDNCWHWLQERFRRAGTDGNMADRLYDIFVRAGLKAPQMRMQTFIAGGAATHPMVEALAELVGTLAPNFEELGIATRAEMDVATLEERMKREIAAVDAMVIGRSEVGAWARL
jgi:ubiquinone/menaquinone biosynthesis C-methylase UbiE